MTAETIRYDVSDQFEVFLIYLLAVLAILLRNVLYQCAIKRDVASKCAIFLVDFSCVIAPMILVQTVLSNQIFELIATLLFAIISIVLVDFLSAKYSHSELLIYRVVDAESAIHSSVMWLRAMVFISTSVAILGVDLKVFPRHFSKTARFGHSLMDTGTAAFVFINALSDFRANTELGEKRNPFVSIFRLRVPSFFLLLLMGLGRSVFVLLSGYQHVVDEYGVHWNFFVTLFCLQAFVRLIPYPYSMYIGLLIGCVYELCLTCLGGADFVLRDSQFGRSGFIDQNREGIFSLFGYIFLYGLALLYAKISTSALLRHKYLSLRRIFSHGVLLALVLIGLQKCAEYFGGLRASRRLANMPYTFATAALLAIATSGFQLFIYLTGLPSNNWSATRYGIIQAVSRNGLLHFLISNLSTGLINIFLLRRFEFDRTAEIICIFSYVLFTTIIIVVTNMIR